MRRRIPIDCESDEAYLAVLGSDFVSITYVAEKLPVSWDHAKMRLLQLLATGKVEGQKVPRHGWIFRLKQPKQSVTVAPVAREEVT
jgi:hypothetical protein